MDEGCGFPRGMPDQPARASDLIVGRAIVRLNAAQGRWCSEKPSLPTAQSPEYAGFLSHGSSSLRPSMSRPRQHLHRRPIHRREFHLSNIQLDGCSALRGGYALFQAPGGWLADRIGPRKVLAIGVLWWGFHKLITFCRPLDCCARYLIGLALRPRDGRR